MKLEHIGIAINELSDSNQLFERLFNVPSYKTEKVDSEQVETSFFKVGDTKIELLKSSDPDGVIAKFIEKRGEGIHHLAFEVDDIQTQIERLKSEGFLFVQDQVKKGADNKLVCFLHPKTTNGVLVELCQEIKS